MELLTAHHCGNKCKPSIVLVVGTGRNHQCDDLWHIQDPLFVQSCKILGAKHVQNFMEVNVQWLTKPFQCFALFERWLHIKCNKLCKVLVLFTHKHRYVGHMYAKSCVDRIIFGTFFTWFKNASHWKGFVTFYFLAHCFTKSHDFVEWMQIWPNKIMWVLY